jgi:hypothetical protein
VIVAKTIKIMSRYAEKDKTEAAECQKVSARHP